MAYDNPKVITYSFGEIDVADAPEISAIKGPTGMEGRILDICCSCTETFNAVSTSAFLRLGTGTDADAYAQMTMGTTADTDAFNTWTRGTTAVLPVDTQIEVAFIANTGGTPAGKGFYNIAIMWYND